MKEVEIKFNFNGFVREEDVLNEVRRQVEEHNESGKQAIKDLIDLSLKTKTLITLVRNQHRGFGKSFLLAEKAKEMGATLVVAHNHLRPASYPFNSSIVLFESAEKARGVKFGNGKFIVDEGVAPEVIKELSMRNEFLGGFSRL